MKRRRGGRLPAVKRPRYSIGPPPLGRVVCLPFMTSSLSFSPIGNRLLITSMCRRVTFATVTDNLQLTDIVMGDSCYDGNVDRNAWSPDGKSVALCTTPSSISVLDAATGVEKFRINCARTSVCRDLTWSADGKTLKSIEVGDGGDWFIVSWSTFGGEVQSQVTTPPSRLIDSTLHRVMQWSKDGTHVAYAGSSTQGTCVHDFEQGRDHLHMSDTWVRSLAWSPNKQRLACGLMNGGVDLWDHPSSSKKPMRMRRVPSDPCANMHSSLAWSPEGTRVAIRTSDGLVIVWDTCTGECLGSMRTSQSHSSASSIAWPRGGRYIATVHRSSLQFWDVSHMLSNTQKGFRALMLAATRDYAQREVSKGGGAPIRSPLQRAACHPLFTLQVFSTVRDMLFV